MKVFVYTTIAAFAFYTTTEVVLASSRENRYIPKVSYYTADGHTVTVKVTELGTQAFQSMAHESQKAMLCMLPMLLQVNTSAYVKNNDDFLKSEESVHLKNNDDFLKLEEIAAKNIKSIIFEGITIDDNFLLHYYQVMPSEYSMISFVRCCTDGVSFAEVLDSCTVENLSIIESHISASDFSEVLLRINQHAVKKIDISRSGFCEKDESPLREILLERVHGRMSLDKLILDNLILDKPILDKLTFSWFDVASSSY